MNQVLKLSKSVWRLAAMVVLVMAALGLCGRVQGQTAVNIKPDCVVNFNFTAAGSTAAYTNLPAPGGTGGNVCTAWVVSYAATGYSALSLTVQSAPAAAASQVTPGTWVTYTGTVVSGINPNTDITGRQTFFSNDVVATPFMRVNLAGLTGSGRVWGMLYGYKVNSVAEVIDVDGTCPEGAADEVQVTDGTDCVGDINFTWADDYLVVGPRDESASFSALGPGYGGLYVANFSAAAQANNTIVLDSYGVGRSPNYKCNFARGTYAVPLDLDNGDDICDTTYQAWFGGANAQAARMLVEVDGVPGTYAPGRMNFYTNDGTNVAPNLAMAVRATKTVQFTYAQLSDGVAFASLPTPTNGMEIYCTNCTVTSSIDNTCATSGAGAWATRLNGAWKCLL